MEYVQVDPGAQVVHPEYPVPAHWPYSAWVHLSPEVVVGTEVVIFVVGVIVVVDVGPVVVPDPPPFITTVTTAWAPTDTVTAPPESVTAVLAT